MPRNGCSDVYVTGTGLDPWTNWSSCLSCLAAAESGGNSSLRMSRDFFTKSNFFEESESRS